MTFTTPDPRTADVPLFDYHLTDYPFNFALQALKEGRAVARTCWPAGKVLKMQQPDLHSKMTAPYLYSERHGDHRAPYTLTNHDLFMSDWYVL